MANMHVLHSSFWGDPHVCKKRGPVFQNSSELLGQTPIPVPNQKVKFRLVDNIGTLWESIGLCSLLIWKFIHILKSWFKYTNTQIHKFTKTQRQSKRSRMTCRTGFWLHRWIVSQGRQTNLREKKTNCNLWIPIILPPAIIPHRDCSCCWDSPSLHCCAAAAADPAARKCRIIQDCRGNREW